MHTVEKNLYITKFWSIKYYVIFIRLNDKNRSQINEKKRKENFSLTKEIHNTHCIE